MTSNGIPAQRQPSATKIVVAYVLCCLVGGTAYFSVRQQLGPDGYPPFLAASVRFTGGALGYLIVAALAGMLTVSRKDLKYLVAGGLCSAVAHLFLYQAARHLPGGLTTVLVATCPMMAALLAWVTRSERIPMGTIAGAGLATIGVLLVFRDRLQAPEEMWAVAYTCIGTFLLAFCNLAIKRLQDTPVLTRGGIFFLVASPVLWIAYSVDHQRLPPGPLPHYATAWVAYTTIFISGVAFGLYLWLMKHVGLMRTMSCVFIQILVAMVIDLIWEPQPLGWIAYAGSALVVAGVVLEWRLKDRLLGTTTREVIKLDSAGGGNGDLVTALLEHETT
jgi:drug/metabolite transporter (DMT)-like permease